MRGPGDNLSILGAIGISLTGGTFAWRVNDTLERGSDYAIKITQEFAGLNYWGPITILRSNGTTTSSMSTNAPIAPTRSSSSASASTESMDPGTVFVESKKSLSTGAKAGIGVGAGFGGLCLALGSFLIGMSARRKKSRRKEGVNEVHAHYGLGKAEIDSKSVRKGEIHELDATERTFEMTAYDRPVELQGGGESGPNEENAEEKSRDDR